MITKAKLDRKQCFKILFEVVPNVGNLLLDKGKGYL